MSSVWTMRRSATDAKIGGVCGGVAEQWGVDPVLVRVGAVLLGLSGGIGVVLYAAAWLMIPVAGQQHTHLDDVLPQARRWPRAVKVLIVVAACVTGAGLLAPVLPFGFGSALILAAIWYFGYYKHRTPGGSTSTGSSAPGAGGTAGTTREADPGVGAAPSGRASYDYFTFTGPRTPFTQAAQAWQERMREYEHAGTASGPGYGPAADAEQARAWQAERDAFLASPDPVGLYTPSSRSTQSTPVRRSGRRVVAKPARRLRLAALVVLGLTMSGLAVASSAGVPVSTTTYLAAALLVAGLTLVVAARVGRARGILPVALLLALATGISAAGAPTSDQTGVGVRQVAYTDGATVPAVQDWDSGSLTVDLTGLRVQGSRTVSVHVDQGALIVIAPPAARVRVVGQVDDGMIKIGDQKGRWGSELTATAPYSGTDPTGPVLVVNASVDQGMLEVRR